MALPAEIARLLETWSRAPFDGETRRELEAIAGNEKELVDRFYRRLEFGTGGMRGVMGAGTNRMNAWTVAAASAGLAAYVQASGGSEAGIVVGYDSRHRSAEFAAIAAAVFAAAGLRTFLFPTLCPVSLVAFAVRNLACRAGVMLTASHNPPQYNGYKVFWEDGCQVVEPHDTAIIERVNALEPGSVAIPDQAALQASGAIRTVPETVTEAFYQAVLGTVGDRHAIDAVGSRLGIVYTPLHGTGNLPVREVLARAGFKKVSVVPEQELPDGAFPTVAKPNPEEGPALAMAVALAEREDAELVLATDPDADRVGIAVRDLTGRFILLNGNQTGCLLIDHRLAALAASGRLPENGAVISTIVTTPLFRRIAEGYGAACFETLTGFKHIGTKMREFEERAARGESSHRFLCGGEESYGYLVGEFVRDKDAVSACLVLAEAAAAAAQSGGSLYRRLLDIYRRFGCYRESLVNLDLYGKEGMERIGRIMDGLRGPFAGELASAFAVVRTADFRERLVRTADGASTALEGFPRSDVLQFETAAGHRISVRPSGTEPKMKFYFSAAAPVAPDADDPAVVAVWDGLASTLRDLEERLAALVARID